MEKENKSIKGFFTKIDETTYKINGNDITFLDEGDMELIPIVRDIVVQEENIAIENYHLSRSSYTIEKKEVPVADLITEINNFLDSRRIRRKKLENGICYYETKNKKLSVEEELIPLVEDIIYERDRPIEEYELQKKAYLVNNKKLLVNDIVLRINDLLSWYDLKCWIVDGIHYRIEGEDFYLEEDDVQIIEELINDESELDRSKYEHKKCAYDIDRNECSIIVLGLYINFLLYSDIDGKIKNELKELCLKNKLDRNKKDFAEKVYCFMLSLPFSIRRLLIKGEKEYNDLSTARIKELDKDMDNNPRWKELSFTTTIKNLLFFFENPLEQYFEGTSEEMELLLQKLDSENEEDFHKFLDKELKEKRLHLKDDERTLDDVLESIDIKLPPYEPLDEAFHYYLQAFVNVYNEEYEQWKDNVREKGIIDSDLIYDFCSGDLLSMNMNFLFWYYYFEGQFFDRFFHTINYGFIRPEVMKSTIDKLQELGLSKYVQKRYDEYRKFTGGGKDFCFSKLDLAEVAKALSPYYSKLPSGRKNHAFTNYYLSDVINDVVPSLGSGLDVVAFALLLWESKPFKSTKDNEKFISFRDDIARIFQLDDIPNISSYKAGNSRVKEKANKLMGQFECLESLLDGKTLT